MVAARRVSMDTSFGPVFHITAPPTFGHQLPSSSVVDDFSFNFLSEEEALKTLVCVSTLKVLKFFSLSPSGLEENYFVMPKEKCSDCEPLEAFKEVLLSCEALKPKLDRCLKVR